MALSIRLKRQTTHDWQAGDTAEYDGKTGVVQFVGESPYYGDNREMLYVVGINGEFADYWPTGRDFEAAATAA